MKTKSIILIVIVVCLCVVSTYAQDASASGESERRTDRNRLDVVARFTLGVVVGDVGTRFDRITDRTFYGLAGGLEYRLIELISLGVNLEANWKNMSTYNLESVRMTGYSGSALVRLSRNQKRTAYVRGELGRTSASWNEDPMAEYVDVGTSTFGRIGFGMFQYGSPKTSARFELYYRRALSGSDMLDNRRGVQINANPDGVGLEFALMFSVI